MESMLMNKLYSDGSEQSIKKTQFFLHGIVFYHV